MLVTRKWVNLVWKQFVHVVLVVILWLVILISTLGCLGIILSHYTRLFKEAVDIVKL